MKKFIPLMLAAFLFIAGQSVIAQTTNEGDAKAKQECKGKEGCKGKGCMQNIPDLTEQQVQKIEELCLTTKKEINGIKNQMGEKQAHLKTLQDADKADMAAINKTIDEISALKADMMKKHEATRQTIRGLLTEKQKIVFDSKPKGGCAGGEGEEKCGSHSKEAKSCCPGGGQGEHKCSGQNAGGHKCGGNK